MLFEFTASLYYILVIRNNIAYVKVPDPQQCCTCQQALRDPYQRKVRGP
jgi:hypothetical protein